jgi:hypothetical protein
MRSFADDIPRQQELDELAEVATNAELRLLLFSQQHSMRELTEQGIR